MNYAPARAAAVTGAMAILAPILALCAVWEAATLRVLWGLLTVRRQWWLVLAARLAPVLAVGVLIHLALYAEALLLPSPAWPGWELPSLSLVGVLAWTAFGAALALVLGRLLAMTAALLVPYLALTLPAGWQPFWLRHVNGSPFDCCSTSEVLDPRVLVGSVGVLGAVAVLSVCVAQVRLAPSQYRPWAAAVVAVAALVGAAGGITAVAGLGPMPTRTRPADALVCRLPVCLWPEDAAAFAANEAAWRAASAAWTDLGLPAPAVDRIGPIQAEGMLAITTTATSEESARATMAQMLPRALANCLRDFSDPARDQRLDQLSALLAAELGVAQALGDVAAPVPTEAPRLWREVGRCGE
ncbi:hypothetical protein ACQEVZ_60125 [Dactylosporangium sp. CA-152071]|uniref:hypothetical protein n=1 Tax=Dactylosporangium sp. CA-152071 TaxID=3239933 RepID=UPI003D8E050A